MCEGSRNAGTSAIKVKLLKFYRSTSWTQFYRHFEDMGTNHDSLEAQKKAILLLAILQ
jgi:hypothetical protein